jgi:hypothetical protein
MASWSAVLAWSGFQYSGVDGSMTLARRKGTGFWSNGSAWGSCRMTTAGKKTRIEISVSAGALKLARFSLDGGATHTFKTVCNIVAGKSVRFSV